MAPPARCKGRGALALSVLFVVLGLIAGCEAVVRRSSLQPSGLVCQLYDGSTHGVVVDVYERYNNKDGLVFRERGTPASQPWPLPEWLSSALQNEWYYLCTAAIFPNGDTIEAWHWGGDKDNSGRLVFGVKNSKQENMLDTSPSTLTQAAEEHCAVLDKQAEGLSEDEVGQDEASTWVGRGHPWCRMYAYDGRAVITEDKADWFTKILSNVPVKEEQRRARRPKKAPPKKELSKDDLHIEWTREKWRQQMMTGLVKSRTRDEVDLSGVARTLLERAKKKDSKQPLAEFQRKAPSTYSALSYLVSAVLGEKTKVVSGGARLRKEAVIRAGTSLADSRRVDSYGTLGMFFRAECGSRLSMIVGITNEHVVETQAQVKGTNKKLGAMVGAPVSVPARIMAPVYDALYEDDPILRQIKVMIVEWLAAKKYPGVKKLSNNDNVIDYNDIPNDMAADAEAQLYQLSTAERNFISAELQFDIIESVPKAVEARAQELIDNIESLSLKSLVRGAGGAGIVMGVYSAGRVLTNSVVRRVHSGYGSSADLSVVRMADAMGRSHTNEQVRAADGATMEMIEPMGLKELEKRARAGEQFYKTGARTAVTEFSIMTTDDLDRWTDEYGSVGVSLSMTKDLEPKLIPFDMYKVTNTQHPGAGVMFRVTTSGTKMFDYKSNTFMQIMAYKRIPIGGHGDSWLKLYRETLEDVSLSYENRHAKGNMYLYQLMKYLKGHWNGPAMQGDSGGVVFSSDGKVVGQLHHGYSLLQGLFSSQPYYLMLVEVTPINDVEEATKQVLATHYKNIGVTYEPCANANQWTLHYDLNPKQRAKMMAAEGVRDFAVDPDLASMRSGGVRTRGLLRSWSSPNILLAKDEAKAKREVMEKGNGGEDKTPLNSLMYDFSDQFVLGKSWAEDEMEHGSGSDAGSDLGSDADFDVDLGSSFDSDGRDLSVALENRSEK